MVVSIINDLWSLFIPFMYGYSSGQWIILCFFYRYAPGNVRQFFFHQLQQNADSKTLSYLMQV